MHQNRASPFASDFCRRRGCRREFRRARITFACLHRRKNRGSLAIFFAEEIAHFGASKSRAIFPGAVKSPPQPQRIARFWCTQVLGSKFLRQDSEMALPGGSVSDLPFSLKMSWELVCLRTARSLLQTLPRRLPLYPKLFSPCAPAEARR